MDENKEFDDIGKLLADYQKQKERRENGDKIPDGELAPPREHIDFAADNESLEELTSKDEEDKKADDEPKKINTYAAKETLEKIKSKLFTKKTLIILAAIIGIIALAVGIKYGVNASKGAYLKPYEKKYGIEYPEGILKEYCDLYGENQSTVGYIKIGDIELESPVYIEGSGSPSVKRCRSDSRLQNYVVTLDTKELENYYASADSYNEASGIIEYSNLFSNYTYKVIGAFYTNTNPEDDNGYVFPYDTVEEMTQSSAATFVTDLQTRFLYHTADSFSRKDRLLIIACPTDYHKNFEFVIVCKLTDDKSKSTATENDDSRIHYPQVICDEKGEINPYRFANGWYPEIVIYTDYTETGEPITETQKLTSVDYQ